MGGESGGSELQLEALKIIVVSQQHADCALGAAEASISGLGLRAATMRSGVNGLRAAFRQRHASAHPGGGPDGRAQEGARQGLPSPRQGLEPADRVAEAMREAGGEADCGCGEVGRQYVGDHAPGSTGPDTAVAGTSLSGPVVRIPYYLVTIIAIWACSPPSWSLACSGCSPFLPVARPNDLLDAMQMSLSVRSLSTLPLPPWVTACLGIMISIMITRTALLTMTALLHKQANRDAGRRTWRPSFPPTSPSRRRARWTAWRGAWRRCARR
jgi:hypothetical protein